MGGTYSEGFSQTDGWKLGVLFLLFVVISYAFIEFNARLEHYLKEKKLRALRHVLHKLQHEIMLLGFISLSLIALQEPLLKNLRQWGKFVGGAIHARLRRRQEAILVGDYDSSDAHFHLHSSGNARGVHLTIYARLHS